MFACAFCEGKIAIMIRVRQLSLCLQKQKILESISFTLHKGRMVMLLGENGAGKTSLLKSMLRYYPLSGGQVLYCGIDCAALRDKEACGNL